jgi:hypothetical protein
MVRNLLHPALLLQSVESSRDLTGC